jgi:hypothetical protein
MSQQMIEYKFKIRFKNIIDLLYGVLVLLFFVVLIVFFEDIVDSSEITIILLGILMLLLLIFGILPIMMFVQYYLKSKTKICINPDTNTITINDGAKSKTINIDEIEAVEIYKTQRIGVLRFDFDYAKYFTKGKLAFIITSLMTNDFYVPEKIKPMEYESIYQFIPKKLEKSKTEYQRFLDKYDTWANTDLENIIETQERYRETAVNAAKEILKKRKSSA